MLREAIKEGNRTNSNAGLERVLASSFTTFAKGGVKQQRVSQQYHDKGRYLLGNGRFIRQVSSNFTVQPLRMQMFITMVHVQRRRQLVIMPIVSSFTILPGRRSSMVLRLYIIHLPCEVVLNIVTMVLGRRANRAGAMPFHGARRV